MCDLHANAKCNFLRCREKYMFQTKRCSRNLPRCYTTRKEQGLAKERPLPSVHGFAPSWRAPSRGARFSGLGFLRSRLLLCDALRFLVGDYVQAHEVGGTGKLACAGDYA